MLDLQKKSSILIKNCYIFSGKDLSKKDILIENGIIKKIGYITPEKNFFLIEKENLLVSLGFIDLHTHLREPGFSYKETIKTGTMAAVSGGYTTLCSMPNLDPAPDCYENLKLQINLIKKDAKCEVFPFMSMTKNRKGNKISDFYKISKHHLDLFVGITDDGNSVENAELMEEICRLASENDILISSHCEFVKLYPDRKAEYEFLKRDLELVKKYKCRYHAQHISCVESIDLIKRAKYEGLNVSCEVTPHHLALCEDDIKDNGAFKMSPPLRSKKDKKAIKGAIIDGTIDAIATDHAPHLDLEKNINFNKSLNGVVGVETSFPIVYNEMIGLIPLEHILRLFTTGPGLIIRKNVLIKEGIAANLVVIDLQKKWKIDSRYFFSKGRSTPFEGKLVCGKVIVTLKNGEIVFKDISF